MSRLLPRLHALTILVLIGGLLAACGSSDDEKSSPEGEHVIEHAYGSTEVLEKPERVVSLGWSDVENAIALGVTPVGFRDWFGEGINDWAADEADGTPESVTDAENEFQYEKIATLDPDLIFANDGMTEEQYERLSEIAPTVGPIEAGDGQTGSYGVPWDEALIRTGKILNREDQAEEMTERVEQSFADLKADHPEYQGTTAAMGFPPGPDDEPGIAASADPRFQPLLNLGFEPSPAVERLDDDGEEGLVEFSMENLESFESDVLFLYAYEDSARTEAMKIRAFANLDVVKNDRVIWMPADVADALTFGTALSMEYVLDELPPLIAEKLPAE